MSLFEHYNKIIKKAILDCGYDIDKAELFFTSRPDLGYFQCNDAMKLAKKYKKSPNEIAHQIIKNLNKNPDFVNLNVAGPGFINISISDDALIRHLCYNHSLSFKKEPTKSKNILLDYGGANVAKALHVGHIRSANIGESLKRLCSFLGNNVLSDVHLGDWGLQMGMIIYEIKQLYPHLAFFDESIKKFDSEKFILNNEELESLYPLANKQARENDLIMCEAKKITSDLQKGKPGYIALWKNILSVSVKNIKKIYDKLNVNFDIWSGESDSSKYVDEMLAYLKSKNLVYENNGALIMNVDEPSDLEPVPPLILKKSDGADLYSTTELATLYCRMRNYQLDEIWYIVDNRQSLHFKQVFRAAYKSGIVPRHVKLRFIGFGTINGKDNKPFKTREGKAMTLDALLHILKSEVVKNLSSDIVSSEVENIADSLSIAVLKCADLSPNISTDYIFDPVKFTQLNGKTGIYLVYSTLRIKSLLKKVSKQELENSSMIVITDDIIRNIVIKVLTFRDTLEISFKELSLNKILEYLFDLNKLYNNFYSKSKILTEANSQYRTSWIFISKIIYEINIKLLKILAINLPDKI